MSEPNIVSELLRAANILERLPPEELRQLLHRSIISIRDLRLAVGIPGSGTASDAIIGLADIAARPEEHSPDERRMALLEAADMIRTLRIVASSGVELSIREAEDDPVA